MIVIIAVMIAVTGTVMTNVIPATTDEDKPTKVEKFPKLVNEIHTFLQNIVDFTSLNKLNLLSAEHNVHESVKSN